MRSQAINNHEGFTLVEVTIIMLVLAILSAILLPTIERFIDLARWVRAKEETTVIASAIVLALHDMQLSYFYVDGNGPAAGFDFGAPNPLPANRANLLVSDGSIPDLDVPPASVSWVMPVGLFANVDLLANHLVSNTPFGSTGNRYFSPADFGKGMAGWRGAYLSTPVSADPWGSRYAVNVEWLDPNHFPALPVVSGDVVVLCVGPDQTVQSEYTASGLMPRGDDFMVSIKGGY